MTIQELLHELQTELESYQLYGKEDTPIYGIEDDSRNVKEGYVFVAIQGYSRDGHDYIDEALQNGACAIIVDKEVPSYSVPYFNVKNSRKALGVISKSFYHSPSKDKMLIGITGTNGKTTTSYLLKQVIEANGQSCSLIGTTQNIINGEVSPSINTTPNSLGLNKLLTESNDQVVIMEVSSHALTQYRVEGMEFDYALFTNLSQDHLDYHASMEEYFEAKSMLFGMLKENGKAVVNIDDGWGEQLAHNLQSKVSLYTIGKDEQSDFRMNPKSMSPPSLEVQAGSHTITISPELKGLYNMYNVTMAFATAQLIGIDPDTIKKSLEAFAGVEGRFQVYKQQGGATAVIDYAHTPDAIFHCLTTVREQGARNIIHVFGFRGDRDPTKRASMLSTSSELSDSYILTFDNLNTVSSNNMKDTLLHLQNEHGNEKGTVIPDRTLAIKQALEWAGEEDWVVITGKGNEKYQQEYELQTSSDPDTVSLLTKA
ncbi:UDP-N-acetylmuramoyl-L-alanyl-D-glutamate--2,6-diaminopimelate ligase [Pontibacillus yanchengensis]|uniref:UDP-N-acetylmuramoyl-L-alanyl-D-glutamate--2, 6-diaminopimelate ligase n=1 Tax=Pontibacillus yanchengensis TaxID=462910 RepID=UPI00055D91FC|nr:UDP-N-acetylmuramoyl-L-alanyl-D-glutamate--2,6-diaminopimelate ligase [Pontibacillus yanchengensis]